MSAHHPQQMKMIGPDADHSEINGACITFRWGHSCPADQAWIALFARQAGAPFMVNLHLRCPRFGLHVNYTPDGAREIARALIETADDVDRRNAEQTNSQLATTLGKPMMDPQEIERRVSASRNIGETAPHMEPAENGPSYAAVAGIVIGALFALAGAFKLLALAMQACHA